MITTADFKHILFLDIETVACQEYYQQMDERIRSLWDKKAYQLKERDKSMEHLSCEEIFYRQGGVFSEFGKIVVIGMGCLRERNGNTTFTVKCIGSSEERSLLSAFLEVINKYDQDKLMFCAHNGKEFDFPYIARRMLINNLQLPESLAIYRKKPWEVMHLDTLDLWRFGDRKSYTSLDLLAASFGIPSSKADMDGSQVGQAFYKDKNLPKIAEYCSLDVVNVAQVLLKMSGLPIVEQKFIEPVKYEFV